ncbi:hypothetical protein A71_257 [Escherichia phage A7_1]|uniref:Uncharacterized protein n=2 Tax=Vequintavirinae TaxID=1911928 RepID=A0AAE9W177_9CAUD|nr:hypothetical protein A71_257 [Escherichia phage A7_1]UZZ64340.1 hypothetical protein A54_100 [Escherichia phage A5-4]WBF77684.1 hypothetical protein A73_6 [Escherichia phage A73]
MSIAMLINTVEEAKALKLRVELIDQPGGDLLVQIYPPKDDSGAYDWCYSDTFEQVDIKAITSFINRAILEQTIELNGMLKTPWHIY